MSDSICRDCKRPIVWAKSPNGKNMPLEKTPIYSHEWIAGVWYAIPVKGDFYIPHFNLCPQRSETTEVQHGTPDIGRTALRKPYKDEEDSE